jgi:hypothetical protein
VQQHTRTAPLGAQSLEDYNPFENETKPVPQSQPAQLQPQTVQNLPPYNPSGQQFDNSGGVTQISTAELQVK